MKTNCTTCGKKFDSNVIPGVCTDCRREANIAKAVVGAPATIQHWTDRTPCEVVAVSPSRKTIVLRVMDARRTDRNGMSECQSYEYSSNPLGTTYTATLRSDGRYRVAKARTGETVSLGYAEKYHDFSF